MTSPTDDAAAKYGVVGQMVQSIPELKAIFDQAVNEQWTADRFTLAIQNTDFWKTHDAAMRNAVQLAATDPAEYNRQLEEYRWRISNAAAKMGTYVNFYSSPDSLTWANRAMAEGWDDTRIQRELAYSFTGDSQTGSGGQAAQIADQLRAVYDEWGLPPSESRISSYQQEILRGTTTIEQLNAELKAQAKSLYPGLSQLIDQGVTVKQAADPYVQQYANLLELDPTTVDWKSNDLISKALQGVGTMSGGTTQQPTTMPLWQFQQEVRKDPQWGQTANARASVDSTLLQLGRAWGFTG